MHDFTLYLINNPFIALGLALLSLLTAYNVLRRQQRVAMGLWLTVVAVLFYVYVQVSGETEIMDKQDKQLVAPPIEAP